VGLFDDVSRFLETRLEEFLRNNPHLELQALEEQLREQEKDVLRLIIDLQKQEKTSQDSILATAEEIKLWHSRIEKAKAAGKLDLAQAAQEREATLLRQGNQLWGQMQGLKTRIKQSKDLQQQIQVRQQEVRVKAAQVQTARATPKTDWDTTGWNQSNDGTKFKDKTLEEKFRRWEAEQELERMKRDLGK